MHIDWFLYAISVLGLPSNGAKVEPSSPSNLYETNRCEPTPTGWKSIRYKILEIPDHNNIMVNRNYIKWNGFKITETELSNNLKNAEKHKLSAIFLIFEPKTPCFKVFSVRKYISNLFKCESGRLCIEYSLREWQWLQPPPYVR